ncbi:MAG: L,D-transpeptidase [Candidatus Dormibacteraeota bacterium]|nr:L,D-transpeptidase [Candidatus Dormibacteraeota bacterium]
MAAVTTATSTRDDRRGASVLGLWPHALVLLLVAGIVAAAVLTAVITGAVASYNLSRASLESDVKAARSAGFTDDDLRPVLAGVSALHAAAAPHLGQRLSFYQHQKAVADNLRSELTQLRGTKLAEYRQQFDSQAATTKQALDQDRGLGVADEDLAPLQKSLNDVSAKEASAVNAADLRKELAALAPVGARAAQLGKDQAAENTAITQQTAALKAAHPNDLEGIRHDGQAALVTGRNDGTLAGWLKLSSLDRMVAGIETAGTGLGGPDLDQVARAAATVQVRNNNFHNALAAAMPEKVIHVSLTDQHMWAYEHGKVVFDTLITTGRPQLPTDSGPMSVLWKVTPWKMHSPWPRTSQWWYPDTTVRKVVWFTATGEGFHDANWEPNSMYGPGSQFNQNIASHGCIHMPGTTVDFLYDWAPVGTPVIVIPGDGSPASEQLKHDTIDTPAGQTAVKGS